MSKPRVRRLHQRASAPVAETNDDGGARRILLRLLRHAVSRAESTVQHQQVIVALVRDWVELESEALLELSSVAQQARSLMRSARDRDALDGIIARVQETRELAAESKVAFESVSDYESGDESDVGEATAAREQESG